MRRRTSVPGVADGGYEEDFGLFESPFSLVTSQRFLFQSASYRAAVEEISDALAHREPVIVVTGAIGTGKTMLCRMVVERRGAETVAATISRPPRDFDDLLHRVLHAFGLLTDDTSEVIRPSRSSLLKAFQQFLGCLASLKMSALIIFDEAHQLPPGVLEGIRVLLDIQVDGDHFPLQIILVGQPELEVLLTRDDVRQLSLRISRRHRLAPLEPTEVSAYLDHRLRVACADQSGVLLPQFSESALTLIARLSQGIPRSVNLLCDRALESAWKGQTRSIDAATVLGAARSLNLPVPLPIRLRLERRYAGAAAAIVLAVALLWTMGDVAASRWTGRFRATPETIRFIPPSVPSAVVVQREEATASAPAPVSSAPAAAQRQLAAANTTGTEIERDSQPAPPAAVTAKTVGIQKSSIDELLENASALALQANVKALQLLRDEIVRRQEGAAAVNQRELKSASDQLDIYLAEARRRRLELDGLQLAGSQR